MGVLQAWASSFLTGWAATGNVLAVVLGGLAAVIVAAAVLGLTALVLSAVFDNVTDAMAKRWKRKGRRPSGRWANIIAGGHRGEEY